MPRIIFIIRQPGRMERGMFNRKCFIVLFIFLFSDVFGESPAMQAYLQRFIRADLLGKVDILNEASSNSFLGSSSLYEYAIQFVIDSYAQIDDLRDINDIISISKNALIYENNAGNIDNIRISNIINNLWKLFIEYPDPGVRGEIIIALSNIGKGNHVLIERINNYLAQMNNMFLSGEAVDYSIVSACISALMVLGDSSSYPALFAIICSGFPEVIASESYGALVLIPGNLHQFIFNIIEKNPPNEKYAAFRSFMNSERLKIPERGQLAETALSQSLLAGGDDADLTDMRYDAVRILSRLRWTRANTLAIRHYYIVQADYNHDLISKDRFLEAIACLGAVGNSDAALVLGLQLGLINIRTESTGVFDEEITHEIVHSLGLIGDNAAFYHLSYVTNLPYTDYIIAAAEEAISRLKW